MSRQSSSSSLPIVSRQSSSSSLPHLSRQSSNSSLPHVSRQGSSSSLPVVSRQSSSGSLTGKKVATITMICCFKKAQFHLNFIWYSSFINMTSGRFTLSIIFEIDKIDEKILMSCIHFWSIGDARGTKSNLLATRKLGLSQESLNEVNCMNYQFHCQIFKLFSTKRLSNPSDKSWELLIIVGKKCRRYIKKKIDNLHFFLP